MVSPAGGEKKVVHKSVEKPEGKGSTIAPPPMEIDLFYERDFESKPVWQITRKGGLGFWPKEAAKDGWKAADRRDTPAVTGADLQEIESADQGEHHYVLVRRGADEVWIDVGPVLETQAKKGYSLAYQYATQTRKAQYGIRGSAEVRYDGHTVRFKMMAVRAKTRREGEGIGTKSGPYTLVGPGLYQGYVQARGKYANKHGDDGLYKSLSIYIWGQWEDGAWVSGVKKAKGRSHNVFIHPAHFPDWLDGCIALGHTFSEYGFESADDSATALREVFALLGIESKESFTKAQKLPDTKKPKAIIRVTDNRPVTLKVRIEVDPADARSADDRFTLTSTNGAYKKTLTIKDDAFPGDKFVDLAFGDVDRSLSYSLEIDPGKEGGNYFAFRNKPYADIMKLGKDQKP